MISSTVDPSTSSLALLDTRGLSAAETLTLIFIDLFYQKINFIANLETGGFDGGPMTRGLELVGVKSYSNLKDVLFSLPSNPEILSQHSISDLQEGIEKEEQIVYRSNGSRAYSGKNALNIAKKAGKKTGITRLAQIGGLGFRDLPVFQTSRPNTLYHYTTGQNTGSQGKGPDAIQAQISAIMESIEVYCAEPKNIRLIRSSYRNLFRQHVLAEPTEFLPCFGKRPLSVHEDVMWTEALSINLNVPVLVPAESVYVPFFSGGFGCRLALGASTNGLASGSTYLEAVIHGLYEVIERHYESLAERGEALISALAPESIPYNCIKRMLSRLEDYDPSIVALTLPRSQNLPVIRTMLFYEGLCAVGQGCSSNIEMSISRSLSEAYQSLVTRISGAREDQGREPPRFRRKFSQRKLELLYLTDKSLKKRVVDLRFSSLKEEFQFVVKWLDRLGFRNIYVANLTRRGVDVPVVKVIVPRLRLPYSAIMPGRLKDRAF
jgi:YcaO-like protein with predicted kinase domain